MLNVLLVVSVMALFVPSAKIVPSAITTAYSSRSDELNGYGLQLQIGKVSLGYHKVIHSYRIPEKLERPGGISVRLGMANLWELNYDIWQKKGYAFGLGVNKTKNKRMGWQVFGKANIGDCITVRLGYRQIYIGRDATLLTASFMFNY